MEPLSNTLYDQSKDHIEHWQGNSFGFGATIREDNDSYKRGLSKSAFHSYILLLPGQVGVDPYGCCSTVVEMHMRLQRIRNRCANIDLLIGQAISNTSTPPHPLQSVPYKSQPSIRKVARSDFSPRHPDTQTPSQTPSQTPGTNIINTYLIQTSPSRFCTCHRRILYIKLDIDKSGSNILTGLKIRSIPLPLPLPFPLSISISFA